MLVITATVSLQTAIIRRYTLLDPCDSSITNLTTDVLGLLTISKQPEPFEALKPFGGCNVDTQSKATDA